MIGIPLRDNNPTVRKPVFTYFLLLVNIAVYVYQLSLSMAGESLFLRTYGAIPAEITSLQNLHTLFTSMFVHGGFWHLGGNMLYLHIFGDNIEDLLGHFRFLGFYLLCGLAAVVSHIIFDPISHLPMVGASGAIAGILGAYLVSYPRARVLVAIPIFIYIFKMFWIPSVVVLGVWFLFQILLGVLSIGTDGGGVAWFAHIGGFVAGMILVKLTSKPRRDVFQNPEEW